MCLLCVSDGSLTASKLVLRIDATVALSGRWPELRGAIQLHNNTSAISIFFVCLDNLTCFIIDQ